MTTNDRAILRGLAGELAEQATLPVHRERAELWRRLNDLRPARPMVWINELPWHEMNVADELTCRCQDGWARGLESRLRMTLYQWRHLPADMILSPYLSVGKVVHSTGFGLDEQVDIVRTDPAGGVVSRRFHPQIREPADLAKIRPAEVTHDAAATEANLERAAAAVGDLLPVRLEGVKHIWYTPWDNLIRWWGVEQAMFDLVDRPAMVHEAVERTAASMHAYLDQLEAGGLLSPGADNTRVGSGGYGYVSELPEEAPGNVAPPRRMWGCSNAQIFSEISPEMHWEFAVRHDLPWLERWGLNYYGCCEPLDLKIDILRRAPRLRKVSMNYRINLDRAVAKMGGDFVFSYKPNPAYFAERRFRLEGMRRELETVLERASGCAIEIIMKDISTVNHEPRRLWEWERMCREVVGA